MSGSPVVRIEAPATSANLGPGYDALGLALSPADLVEAQRARRGLSVEVTGVGAEEVCRDERHLVVRAMRASFDELGEPQPGLVLRCHNVIPHGRGMGSSAAAIVAGVLAARALVDDGAARLPDDRVLALASRLEGHPDNVAACLLGGLTVAWTQGGAAAAVRRDALVRPVVMAPPTAVSTEVARGLLPLDVPHPDAALNAGRAALLVALIAAGVDDAPAGRRLLWEATVDKLHQEQRSPAMPQTWQLIQRLRGLGHAAVVSGAGPSVLVLLPEQADVAAVTAELPHGWWISATEVDQVGARTTCSPPGVSQS